MTDELNWALGVVALFVSGLALSGLVAVLTGWGRR